ncbi:hypothetical protein [Sorangium sp. So ce381]|uniref:hypothetical protein n=1 Tax=Sorangium sp. So ce381 TaxID=3133307 RepID=UPI003F5B1700
MLAVQEVVEAELDAAIRHHTHRNPGERDERNGSDAALLSSWKPATISMTLSLLPLRARPSKSRAATPSRSRMRLNPAPGCYCPPMPSTRRLAAEIVRMVPPRDRALLLRFGLDLNNPRDAELFVEGVRAAEDAIAAQQRWERVALSSSKRARSRP